MLFIASTNKVMALHNVLYYIKVQGTRVISLVINLLNHCVITVASFCHDCVMKILCLCYLFLAMTSLQVQYSLNVNKIIFNFCVIKVVLQSLFYQIIDCNFKVHHYYLSNSSFFSTTHS